MRAVFRPSTVLGKVRIPALDEDEATFAVAAARALMKARDVRPGSVRRLVCSSHTGKGWGPHVQIALGLRDATLVETEDPGDLSEGTMRIVANAPRPSSPGFGTTEALAVAEFPGDATDVDVSEKSLRAVDATRAEKMVAWETKAPQLVPMGAYVPRGTWDATLDARYRLVAGYCPRCRRGQHPRVEPCPVCGGATQVRELVGPGSLYTFTVIGGGGGPTEFDPFQDTDGTYGVAIVDFGDAIRVAGLLTETDLGALAIGQRMESVFRRIYAQEGSWRYGTKFRLART